MPALDGYTYGSTDFATLLLRKFFPERTDGESAVIKAFLLAHLHEFDTITFGKRLGHGTAPDPSHLSGVQAQQAFSSKLRVSIFWRCGAPAPCSSKLSSA
jgi:hypothetical protein